MSKKLAANSSATERDFQVELSKTFKSKKNRIFHKIITAALGSIPWVGGFLSSIATFKNEENQVKTNELYQQWLEEHTHKMESLRETIVSVMKRLDEFPEELDERLESEEYLQIVRKSFREWDDADTDEKKQLIRKLLTNAGADKLVPDDLVRLFLDWIDKYHEVHWVRLHKRMKFSVGLLRFLSF